MKAMEVTTEELELLRSDTKRISDCHLNDICKYEQESECCRYIMMIIENDIPNKVCAKKTSLKEKIDKMVELKIMSTNKDNCEGL
jgi:hypothetical protein